MIPPIKIKLSVFELIAITTIMEYARKLPLRPDMRTETILLAENWMTWLKRTTSCEPYKVKRYSIPVSVARAIHSRLQQVPTNQANQSLLVKLDQELTNINLKPPFPQTLL